MLFLTMYRLLLNFQCTCTKKMCALTISEVFLLRRAISHPDCLAGSQLPWHTASPACHRPGGSSSLETRASAWTVVMKHTI